MAQAVSKRLQKRWAYFVVIGLLCLAVVVWYLLRNPKAMITSSLRSAGVSPETIKYWVCVSAFETDGWTSRAFKVGHNLFGMTVASRDTTATGLISEPNPEGLAQFKSVSSCVDDFVLYLFTRWKYPKSFSSIGDMVAYMKSKGYFGGDQQIYTEGVTQWYRRIYG